MSKSLDQSIKLFEHVTNMLDKNPSLKKSSSEVSSETECIDYESDLTIATDSGSVRIYAITVIRTSHRDHDGAVYARLSWFPGRNASANNPLMIEYLNRAVFDANLSLHSVHYGVAASYRLS